MPTSSKYPPRYPHSPTMPLDILFSDANSTLSYFWGELRLEGAELFFEGCEVPDEEVCLINFVGEDDEFFFGGEGQHVAD